ncbi:MAG TPA: LysM peptidoglycan-binding domain-containing protein [Acidimicrobiales bacterium]|nr:LysM peptidoglycan-binding domain-containing protein [Acidimicrobiales bacterium]
MAAVEILEIPAEEDFATAPYLRLVPRAPRPLHHGPSLTQRRAARGRLVQRRRRTLVGLVLVAALTILALPGHVFGATTGAGLSTDLAGSSVLASGMEYVVQPGDTVSSIARNINPVTPSLARSLLVRELGSSVVVPGEHVLIP